jgi:GcrA cell cycle regulator
MHLRQLIVRGLGDAAIASALNAYFGTAYTRNSIIGKRARLKIPAPEGRKKTLPQQTKRVLPRGVQPAPIGRPPITPPPKPVPKPVKIAGPPARPSPPRPAQQTKPWMPGGPHVAGMPLILRKMHQCGWPINDGGPFLFCGMPKTYDPTYCDYHRWLATPPGSRHHLGGGTP